MSRLAGRLYLAWCALFVLAPIVVVCAAALNGGRTMLFPPEDPTLDRFVEFFVSDPVWTRALQRSILIAVTSAAIATLIAWPTAYGLWRRDTKISKLLAASMAMPFALPPIVFGVGLGFLWAFSGLIGTIPAGILSHAALHGALPLATISIGLQSIDRAHLDAAATMGATERTTFRTIVLPQTIPYTLSGFFFALVLLEVSLPQVIGAVSFALAFAEMLVDIFFTQVLGVAFPIKILARVVCKRLRGICSAHHAMTHR